MLEDDKPVSQEPRSRPVNAKFARRQPRDDTWRVGVFLRVRGNGEQIWVQHIRVDGQPRKVVLGNFPDLSMSDARRAAAENQHLVDSGGDLVAKQRQDNTRAIRARLDSLAERIKSGGSASTDQTDTPQPATAPVKRAPKAQRNKTALRTPDVVAKRRKRAQAKPTPTTTQKEPNHLTGTAQDTTPAPKPKPTPQKPRMSEAVNASASKPPPQAKQDTAPKSEAQHLLDEARRIGPNVLALIEHILTEDPKSVIGLRRCEGILALKHTSDNYLDEACAQAFDAGDISLTGVMSRVQTEHSQDMDKTDSDPSDMAHANIRGANYFY
ncbi:Arm DNA-binding domain-containing protein [Lacimonas salitolerans]|uniref:Arm DNA-binding domain-containing protein n=1 Tax=Lacimonas salitolerans TaxID=1323750 RepID=A0ABW4EKU4_9RHOB